MQSVVAIASRPWSMRAAVYAAALVLVAGCGGGDDEPTVQVYSQIFQGYLDLGRGSGASEKAEQDLRNKGVRTSNKRCRVTSGYDVNGQIVAAWVDGIHPRNVIFEIPASDLEKAKAAGYTPYDPKEWWQGDFPFREFKCEDAGL